MAGGAWAIGGFKAANPVPVGLAFLTLSACAWAGLQKRVCGSGFSGRGVAGETSPAGVGGLNAQQPR